MEIDELIPDTESPELLRDRIKRALKAKRRLAAVERSGLVERAHTIPSLNRAVRVTARSLGVSIVQINLLTDRMLVPIAVYCAPGESADEWQQPRRAGRSLCKFVLIKRAPLAISNARQDPLVRNTYATTDLQIGSYLAAPIRADPDSQRPGPIIGTVAVIDRQPRAWSSDEIDTISDVARAISEQIAYRLQRHNAAREVEGQLSRILQNVAVGVLATDANGVTTFANPAAETMLGFAASELVGHDQHALIHHSRPDGSRFPEAECPFYVARREGRVHQEPRGVFWRADGTRVTVSATMTPIFERGEVVASVLTFADIGDQLAREDTERGARHAVEAAAEAKSELLRLVAKELEAPFDADAMKTLAGLLSR